MKVADDGIGFSKETANRLFDRFYRSDDSSVQLETGSGLGCRWLKLSLITITDRSQPKAMDLAREVNLWFLSQSDTCPFLISVCLLLSVKKVWDAN